MKHRVRSIRTGKVGTVLGAFRDPQLFYHVRVCGHEEMWLQADTTRYLSKWDIIRIRFGSVNKILYYLRYGK